MPEAAHQAPVPAEAPPVRWADAEERRRSFLRLVSHELRTPLNSVIGFSELLASELHGPLGAPSYKEYAEIIRGSGQKLLGLVNQVLEIARLESGTMDFDLVPESIDQALSEALAGLEEDRVGRGISLQLDGQGRRPQVVADGRGLRTLLGHLLQNAIQYSPEGGRVSVSATVQADRVEIVIRNDGPIILPEDLPRLMQPFEQGESALTRRTEGAGLGLPICQLTCMAMGGRLRLSCAPEGGLVAMVSLPHA